MGLFDKLKTLLGLGGSGSSSEEQHDVGVTVERESGGTEPDAGVERAVKTGDSTDGTEEPEPEQEVAEDGEEAADVESEETESEATEETEEETEEEERRVPSEAVDVIKGIGPTYAGRLSDAGVETVADLAEADPDDVAERADVPRGRVENWIEQAEARSR